MSECAGICESTPAAKYAVSPTTLRNVNSPFVWNGTSSKSKLRSHKSSPSAIIWYSLQCLCQQILSSSFQKMKIFVLLIFFRINLEFSTKYSHPLSLTHSLSHRCQHIRTPALSSFHFFANLIFIEIWELCPRISVSSLLFLTSLPSLLQLSLSSSVVLKRVRSSVFITAKNIRCSTSASSKILKTTKRKSIFFQRFSLRRSMLFGFRALTTDDDK